MPFKLIRADITKLQVDAIVNAANRTLLGGGGVDGAIHRAAGPGLLEECKTLRGCETGQAVLTNGYDLPAKYVIHTVGPVWHGGKSNEEHLLRNCYINSLKLAASQEFETLAFPLISSGVFGYPKDKALAVAIDEITGFLTHHEITVYLVIFDQQSYQISKSLYDSVEAYIDAHYVKAMQEKDSRYEIHQSCSMSSRHLEDLMDELEATFSEHLLRLIDQKGLSDVETYKRANVDRKLFSKIRSDAHYSPSTDTAIAFAIALRLNLDETKDLLGRAGYALSRSNKFDVIIEYFIRHKNYNIHEINETLFAFDQHLLGV